MGYFLKQSSTAKPLLFLMVDSTDHVTGKTGLAPTVTLSKNGAAFASPSGAVTELANGWYKVAGNATDTGTLGPVLLHATSAGADPVDESYNVVAFDPDSATNLGLSALPTAAPAANGGLPTVDASNNVHGLQTRTVSDASVIGTGTGTSTLTQSQVTGGAYALNTDGSGNVKVSSGTGANQVSLTSGAVTVGTNNDKTGYTASTVSDKTGYALTAAYDAAKTAAAAGAQMDLVNAPNATALTAAGTAAWAIATRTITGGTIGTYTGNTPQTGDAFARLGTPAGASVSADVAAVNAKTANLPAAPAAVSDIPTANANADALLDRTNGVETGWTLRQVWRLVASVLVGKASNGGATFRDLNDTKARVTATVDSSGNRTAVTKDAT